MQTSSLIAIISSIFSAYQNESRLYQRLDTCEWYDFSGPLNLQAFDSENYTPFQIVYKTNENKVDQFYLVPYSEFNSSRSSFNTELTFNHDSSQFNQVDGTLTTSDNFQFYSDSQGNGLYTLTTSSSGIQTDFFVEQPAYPFLVEGGVAQGTISSYYSSSDPDRALVVGHSDDDDLRELVLLTCNGSGQ